MQQARVVLDAGYVLDRNLRIVCPPHFHTRFLADQLTPRQILAAAETPVSEKLESAFYLLGPWYRNYYHWLIDFAPLLQSFEAYRRAHPAMPEPVLLFPRWLPAAYEELLNILWPGERRFAYCGETLSISRLLVPSPHKGISWPRLIQGAPPSLSSIRWLQSKVLPQLRQESPRRLLISRSRAHSRRIGNEEELFGALVCLGFERVFLEDHSFLEQANLFHCAEAVIGCHGAGLANLVFCRSGTLVIEIYPRDVARADYCSISCVMGLNYHGVLAVARQNGQRNQEIQVDVKDLSLLASNLLCGNI